MFFAPVGIMEQMRLRRREHYKKYGAYPKLIYLSKEKYLMYKKEFGNPMLKGVWFCGAEVLPQT